MARTAREYGLVDEAYALVVGAHLAASDELETEARQLSDDVFAQASPVISAPALQDRAEELGRRIAVITGRNPLTDETYDGPKFSQADNDYLSGRVQASLNNAADKIGTTAVSLWNEAKTAAAKLGSSLDNLVWGLIVGAVLIGALWVYINRRGA